MLQVLEEYYRQMEHLMLSLCEIFELALGLPSDFFRSRLGRHTSILGLNHYPPITNDFHVKKGQLRIARHTDVDVFTILHQVKALVCLFIE